MAHLTGSQIKHQNQFPAKAPDAQSRHDSVFFFTAAHSQETEGLLPTDMVGRQNRQVTHATKAAAQVMQRSAQTGQIVDTVKLIEFCTGHTRRMVHPKDEADEEKAADFVGRFLEPVSIETFSDSFMRRHANSPQNLRHRLLLFL